MGHNYCPNCGHEMNQGVSKQEDKPSAPMDKKGVSKKAALVISIMKKKGKKS